MRVTGYRLLALGLSTLRVRVYLSDGAEQDLCMERWESPVGEPGWSWAWPTSKREAAIANAMFRDSELFDCLHDHWRDR